LDLGRKVKIDEEQGPMINSRALEQGEAVGRQSESDIELAAKVAMFITLPIEDDMFCLEMLDEVAVDNVLVSVRIHRA
jgi:hypothetical protein